MVYYIGGPWRAYFSYRYNDILSGFSFFFSWYVASGDLGGKWKYKTKINYPAKLLPS